MLILAAFAYLAGVGAAVLAVASLVASTGPAAAALGTWCGAFAVSGLTLLALDGAVRTPARGASLRSAGLQRP